MAEVVEHGEQGGGGGVVGAGPAGQVQGDGDPLEVVAVSVAFEGDPMVGSAGPVGAVVAGHSEVTSVTAARAALSSTIGGAGGEGGDEGLDGQVVDGPGQAPGGLVDEGQGVVGEEGVGAAGEFQVVGDVVGRLGLAVMRVMA